MKLRESLATRRPELYSRLQVTESKAKQFLEYSQAGSHLTFTTHGLSHISAVEDNYDWLLSDNDISAMNPTELFCLLCATFFHDALMIPMRLGEENIARQGHASRAKDFLIQHRDLIGLTLHEVSAISEIIEGHALESLSTLREEFVIGSVLVDIRKLAACLSLADICHADSSRVPEIVFRHLEMDEESAYHWRRHLQISGITRKSERLIMSAVCFSDEGSEAVKDYAREIERQLVRVRPYFHSLLQKITGVDLQEQRLKSQLDVAMRFQANTRAILDILIEGVYQRQDVFLRELVQNGLDACHLRLAKHMRRGEPYSPRVVITLLLEKELVRAVRVDDNGIGMDIGDVQDTVLWIGNSAAKRTDIKKLLSETTGKNLIATFGIGLLSCFKCAQSITLRSAKEARNPIEVQIMSITDEIKPTEAADKNIGSTFIVELRPETATEMDLEVAVDYYFRMVQQASIELLRLDWSDASKSYNRDEIFRIATTEADEVAAALPKEDSSSLVFHQLKSDDFLAWLWIRTGRDGAPTTEGSIDILNEGVFVSTDRTSEWLPKCFDFTEGVINFASGAIDLPVSRDKIISNKKLSQKRLVLADKALVIIDRLVEATKTSSADKAALAVTICYEKADKEMKARIIRRLDPYQVAFYQRDRNISLGKIRDSDPAAVIYVAYPQGRWLSILTTFDNRLLYHNSDDLTNLQAALLRQNGEVVLWATRADPLDQRILEATLLKGYFSNYNIRVVDLTQSTETVSGLLRSKPLPKSIRKAISKDVKFVEVAGLPNKRAWKVGHETWINVANNQMGGIYTFLQSGDVLPYQLDLVEVLFDLVACTFDEALEDLWVLILSGRRVAQSSSKIYTNESDDDEF